MYRRFIAVVVILLFSIEGVRGDSNPRLPVLSNAEAWKRLPEAPEPAQPLPVWARMLAKSMPATTARMLELDAMHRSGARLDARLRGIVRWGAADGIKCAFSKSVAVADLKRAGVEEDIAQILSKNPEKLSKVDRACLSFAQKIARKAGAVTDAEFKEVLDLVGEERMVAIVALLAHASFQDHLFLVLNLRADESADVPPITVKFGHPKPPSNESKRGKPQIDGLKESIESKAWIRLQEGLEKQRARPLRIRVPDRDEVIRRLGSEDHPAAWQSNILWSRVCYGYQPELTDAWFDIGGAFRYEHNLTPMFTNAIFWVVTDSLQCFY